MNHTEHGNVAVGAPGSLARLESDLAHVSSQLKEAHENKPMTCPHCGESIKAASIMGAAKSVKKTAAARENAKKGGWPKGKKRKPE